MERFGDWRPDRESVGALGAWLLYRCSGEGFKRELNEERGAGSEEQSRNWESRNENAEKLKY